MKRILLEGVCCFVALAACNRSTISGKVVNIQGEALPGVAVHVEGTSHQALTDALGHYRVSYVPGDIVLHFLKTGYTPGTLELSSDSHREIEAHAVSLWELPLDKGVYLYENFRYRETTNVVPEEFVSHDRRKVYATRRWPEVETTSTAPLVLCYKMPDWDVRFCRMELTELNTPLPGGGLEEAQVLAQTKTIPARLLAIDQIEGLLRQLEFPGTLQPGSYAVHWGALDGASAREPRIFMFTIVDYELTLPSEEEIEGEETEAAEESTEEDTLEESEDDDIPDVD
ncbi:MAG: carboxypeptidase-like regulatory domain-containing protein [Candidatus Hydrogenedentes bacterium]|nr:carboxypeptidase-like regulatory domain-containing protein [Candidatus Hydrogenedentota bacterium]